jgi:hypothetical protein
MGDPRGLIWYKRLQDWRRPDPVERRGSCVSRNGARNSLSSQFRERRVDARKHRGLSELGKSAPRLAEMLR